jgi:hypothetical protein
MSNYVIVSFCNNPEFTTRPILCVQIQPGNHTVLSYVPVHLGFPRLIHHVTGLTMVDNMIMAAFSSEVIYYEASLDQKHFTPLFYKELQGAKDVHSILALKDQLYVV